MKVKVMKAIKATKTTRRGSAVSGRKPLSIGGCMTRSPHTIGGEQTLEQAHRIMRDNRIRHLPVLKGGRLFGVVSQRDLAIIETLPGVDPAEVPVEDAMSTDIYAVSPRAPLARVAAQMAQRKLGSAVVVEGDRVVGLFTVTDACRVLADVTRAAAGGRPPVRRRST